MVRRNPGERALVTGMTIDALGSGMYVPFSLIFFQRVTGLPLTVIGVVLTVAGLAGMALLPLAGAAVDRFGARRMQLIGYAVRGLGFVAYPFATSLPAFAAVALFTAAGDRAFPAIQQALVGEISTGTDRDRLNALGRSLRNAGLGAGGLLAALIVGLAGDTGFVIAAWLNAASFLVAALIARRLPRRSPAAAVTATDTAGGYRAILADLPFLSLTGANFLIAFGYSALSLLLPAYAVTVLHAPAATTGGLFAVNTALCALGGVPMSRWAQRIGRRSRIAATGAAVFALSFLGFALIGMIRPGGAAVLIVALIGMMILYTTGELVHSPAASTLAIEAAPADLRGRYLASYQLSWSLSAALAPSVFTALLAVDGSLPWLFLIGSALTGAAILLRFDRRQVTADRTDTALSGDAARPPTTSSSRDLPSKAVLTSPQP
ncbi:MFS transporter [Planotetraspora phitsanulokensis]|uniref:MFS transporter n=1 Tax=Planotetraspora phitsanulokensis TaxID=575192 RepID=A0A8J3XFF3_9ACTN|nr:MFS transporter [Planotetraspora phitsanulokensis]GII39607.1 MFS transporter [Planotetraspora phitsanulokensis]